jgi:hypothetical protein
MKYLIVILCCCLAGNVLGQSLRLEELKDMFGKGKPLKLTGGFSANSVLDAGNDMQGRDPFAWYLNGNVNLNIYGLVDLPFSFSLTSSQSSYRLPSSPNRLSISPSYKWITAHIGDVTMNFSPYTLNGHIFTGAGMELKPEGWEFAAMYGRLLKAVEYDGMQPATLPNYKRMGYGLKAGKSASLYNVSLNFLHAGDDVSSLTVPPDSLGITPMENLAGSIAFTLKALEFLRISGEYGLSLLTNDRRSPKENKNGIPGLWPAGNMSTAHYNAFNAHVDLVGENNSIGLGYERIDPGYKTLGAYYFTNDLENITVNAFQSFWQKKINLNVSLGYEHDDLEKTKAMQSSRVVGSANITAAFSERVNANLSYSNVRSNFELINQENPLDKLDTLNFVQLSQNAGLGIDIVTKQTETQQHKLGMNLSYQDAAGKQGGITQKDGVTEMINASVAYSVSFPKSECQVSGAVNINNSKLGDTDAFTFGPVLDVSFKLFKKVSLRNSISYNSGLLEGIKQNEVFLERLNASYALFKKHNFTLAYSFQWRSAVNRPAVNHSLLTVGYSFNF